MGKALTGSPRCSCTITRSVKSLLLHSSTKSGNTCAPRLIRREVGNNSFTSLTNCVSREEGSRDVVTNTFGSRSFALAYSSSAALPFTAVFVSSNAISVRKLASEFRSSVGITLPSSKHCRIFRFFSYNSRSLPSKDLRYTNSLRRRAVLRIMFRNVPLTKRCWVDHRQCANSHPALELTDAAGLSRRCGEVLAPFAAAAAYYAMPPTFLTFRCRLDFASRCRVQHPSVMGPMAAYP
jgi:hypothetical protein